MVLKWLSTTDPSENQNTAQGKYKHGTGGWLLDSEMFESWKTGSNSLIWLHGIPGCGKTILRYEQYDQCSSNATSTPMMTDPTSSIVIERLRKYCKEDIDNRVIGYYYFDFNVKEKQNVPNLLRSLISHLCPITRDLPEAAQQLYREHFAGTPPPHELLKTLVNLIRDSGQVYIVIDALDECGASSEDTERSGISTDLLKVLFSLVCLEASNLHVFVTSRDGQSANEIDKRMADMIGAGGNRHGVALQGDGVDGDIATVINSRVLGDALWRNLDAETRTMIVESLKEKAKGMYVLLSHPESLAGRIDTLLMPSPGFDSWNANLTN
jgi:hypothetical protein